MKRREFIILVGGAAVACPGMVQAQQSSMPVIGFLNSASANLSADRVRAFLQGLSEHGYIVDRDFAIEFRWADSQYDRLPAMAAELVRRNVVCIVATGGLVTAQVAKAATASIPVVFQTAADPVKTGLVASLNRPGGNLTGITSLNVEVGPKRLQLLHELVPQATLIGLLINPANPSSETQQADISLAARDLNLHAKILYAKAERDFDAVFARATEERIGALIIGADALFNVRSLQLASLTARHAIPTITQYREFVAAGGLISYGGSRTEAYHQAGVYAVRILRGEKPANLPVAQSTKVELSINLRAAKTLGLTVPLSLLGRADEVIE